jgi:hypothetical protein
MNTHAKVICGVAVTATVAVVGVALWMRGRKPSQTVEPPVVVSPPPVCQSCTGILVQAEMAKQSDLARYCRSVHEYADCVERKLLIMGRAYEEQIKSFFTRLKQDLSVDLIGSDQFDHVLELIQTWDRFDYVPFSADRIAAMGHVVDSILGSRS